jgi:hypothetical protein
MSGHSVKLRKIARLLGITLMALLAVIGTIIWTDHRSALDSTPSEAIDRIAIQRQGFADITMMNTNDAWQITAPCRIAVNDQRLKPLLSALQPANHRYNAAEVDLDAAGLSPAHATVILNTQEIELGNTDLQGNKRYALLDGKEVVFIPEWVLSLVNGGVSAFARLEPFGSALTRLTLTDSTLAKRILVETHELAPWQALSAQQIVAISDLNLPEPASEQQILAELDGVEQLFNVYKKAEFIALQVADAQCAYILPPESLPVIELR